MRLDAQMDAVLMHLERLPQIVEFVAPFEITLKHLALAIAVDFALMILERTELLEGHIAGRAGKWL